MKYSITPIRFYLKTKIKNYLSFKIKNILLEYENEKIKSNYKKIKLGKNSKLTETAKIVNRQNDSKKINIGENTIVKGELMLMGYGGFIKIGKHTFIGEGTRIWSGESILIGNNVLISHNVNIIDTNSHQINHIERSNAYKDLISSGFATKNNNIECKPIFIDDYAWINFNTTILKGVTIGKGAIIGPNSVVLKDVEPFSFYAGNPAKFIKKIN